MNTSSMKPPFIQGMLSLPGRMLAGIGLLLSLPWLMTHPAAAWTDAELKAMPPYCAGRYSRLENPAEYKRWEAMYGPSFLHTHHLCDAIGFMNRSATTRDKMRRQTLLYDALGNLDYMVHHASPDFALMPDIYLYRAQVYASLNKTGLALNDLFKAIDLNPKLAMAYLLAADQYQGATRKDKALEIVTQGLRHNPDNKGLQRRYVILGGKMPYPEPLPSAVPAAPPTTAPAPQAVPPQGAEQPSASVAQSPGRQEAPPASGADGGKSEAAVSSKNPWCRFCPADK